MFGKVNIRVWGEITEIALLCDGKTELCSDLDRSSCLSINYWMFDKGPDRVALG